MIKRSLQYAVSSQGASGAGAVVNIGKAEVLSVLKGLDLMVLSTLNADGSPQSAVVEFCETPNLEIIFDTLDSSRKYANLQRDNRVALVVGWDNNITIQAEGTARQLMDGELAAAKAMYFAKNPRAKKWGNKPDIAYFLVQLDWLRYSDLNQHPWLVTEVAV